MSELEMPNSKVPVKKAIQPICWLLGKWNSIEAKGQWPGFKNFEYDETMEFKFFGQPLLSYTSQTFMKDNTPKHYETGYLKINPGTNKLCFLLAHNFGLNSVEEGTVDGCTINLKSTEISRMSFAREPAVCKIQRQYQLCEDKLFFALSMETSKTPLTKHLAVIYEKEE